MAEKKGAAARKEEVVTREYTINLHKRLHGWYPSSPSRRGGSTRGVRGD